ncbi:hypothetical protein [Roseisolibacter sp. H3M3-2]|uniref:hypothetical protein n=1 Tax=Roseisolibacter sp. H3M3-2 TaxID=3031323 RepID=UPI0023DAB714|nr:hypothetical protein [Roseisolibacter sp. H3M3-2]MDF1503935.1 hypothetical protein [Roseisolibacter sp. H3M3-2]
MHDRQRHGLGDAFAWAAMGGVACGLLAWMGLAIPSGLAAAALLLWLARRIVDVVPSPARPRLGPTAWSSYDRRRSGRTRLGLRAWRRLRPRRRSATSVLPRPGDRSRWTT